MRARFRLAIIAAWAASVGVVVLLCWSTMSPPVATVATALGLISLLLANPLVMYLDRQRELRRIAPTPSGAEALLGETAKVIKALDPVGKVKLHGEIWNARGPSARIVPVGRLVTVTSCDGMELVVDPGAPPDEPGR
jgi:membrane protein implicated in regulation of membrane protease activity